MTNQELELTDDNVGNENISDAENTNSGVADASAESTQDFSNEKMSDISEVVEEVNNAETEAVPAEQPVVEAVAETPVAEELSPVVEETIEHIEVEEFHIAEEVDYSTFSKKDFVDFAEKLLHSIKKEGASVADIKNADNVLKEIKVIFDDLKVHEKSDALKKYIAENGNDEGFEYKNDNYVVRFEALIVQIRETKNGFFHKLEKARENYFEIKTQLLQKLREVVDLEEQGGSKQSWNDFKKIQEDWKSAGNVNSPHNASLWSAYNALVDRYYSIRNIQNELKELDRKKNLEQKSEIVAKIEAIVQQISSDSLTSGMLKHANELLEEYKHVGPAPRDEQDALWQRLKASFDSIHGKRREQAAQTHALQDEVLGAKTRLIENLKPYITFNSNSINEWNAKTKEILAIQDQWNAIKGAMPRDKGKEISKDFWGLLKTFFRNKGDFFTKLEAERAENLKAKTALCEQVDALLASEDFSAENTNQIISLQKTWKTIGHVPEKFKDSIYERFKKSCDAFFDAKRLSNKEIESEYVQNLKKKIALCEEIEAAAKSGEINLNNLPEFKASYSAIGFVPRKDMQDIQARFVDAINAYVKASSGVSGTEKEKIILQNEVEVVLKSGGKGSSKSLDKQENDIRRKITHLEDDLALWRNNIEFFGQSRNADKLKAEYEKKIAASQQELEGLKDKLKLILAAS